MGGNERHRHRHGKVEARLGSVQRIANLITTPSAKVIDVFQPQRPSGTAQAESRGILNGTPTWTSLEGFRALLRLLHTTKRCS
jgi:hypothetical protein